MVERNHKAGQNPPKVVVPTEEEKEDNRASKEELSIEIEKKICNNLLLLRIIYEKSLVVVLKIR
jgi:hypothetical protein